LNKTQLNKTQEQSPPLPPKGGGEGGAGPAHQSEGDGFGGFWEEERKKKERKHASGRESVDDGFAEFWDAYPKKRSKGDARKAWNVLKPDAIQLGRILEAIARLKTSEQWLREEGRYIPYPATWLRAEGWEDQPDVGVNGHCEETRAEKDARILRERAEFEAMGSGGNPARDEVANRVVEFYQQKVQPAHDKARGVTNVITLLNKGVSEEQLLRCAEGYADWCLRNGREPKYRSSVGNFYGKAKTYEGYLEWKATPQAGNGQIKTEDAPWTPY
jgi:hypothetical protein